MLKRKYNKRIHEIFLSDQKDHSAVRIELYNKKGDWEKLTKRDRKRQKNILKILKNKKLVFTGEDYFMTGIIFQHGTNIADSKMAVSLAKRGAKMGNDKAKWLYAAAIDRLLIRRGGKQKFGTQYIKKKGEWTLYPVNPKTTDRERASYNVIPLKAAAAKAEVWNKKRIDPWKEKRKTTGITGKS